MQMGLENLVHLYSKKKKKKNKRERERGWAEREIKNKAGKSFTNE